MTFCTACAAPISETAEICPMCGTQRLVAASGSSYSAPRSARRSFLLRFLYLAPVLLLVAIAAGFIQRQSAQQEWLASAYAEAEHAASAGDLVSAREGFNAIAGYRDAATRAREMESRLRPLEASYVDGLQAIERGDYAAAVALLEPVADQAPALEDVVIRLDDARRLLANDLQRDVDAAETVRDWPAAERTLRELIAINPADAAARLRLATIQREHGPLVLGRNRELWLVAPDGSDPRLLSDALHVIWPVWSPDRSQVAFLAPDPEDPMGNVSLYTVAIDGSAPRRLVDGVSAHAPPAWSPDGARIAYTSFAGYDPVYETGSISVRVIDVESGVETDLTGDDYLLAFNPSWSPDGAEIAFVVKHQGLGERPQHAPGDVLVARLGEDGFDNLTDGEVRDVWSVAWSPRGDSLLLFSLFGQTWYEQPSTSIRLLDRKSGAIELLVRSLERPTMPVWSPDGGRFAFTVEETAIVVASPAGDRQRLEADDALSGELTWSPDGQAILLAPWDANSASTLLDLSGPEPSLSNVELEFDASPPFVSPPQWSPAVALPPEANPALPPAGSAVPVGR